MTDEDVPTSPRQLDNWADLFSDDEESEPLVITESQRNVNNDSTQESSLKCCYSVHDACTTPELLTLAKLIPSLNNVDCLMSCLREFVNKTITKSKSVEVSDNEKMNLLNSYMHMRHDTLANCVLRLFQSPVGSTDVKFSDFFPIQSNRTPDCILVNDEKYLVIEFTAVSDPERAYKSKGHTDYGYVSKYQRELEIIKSLGFVIEYVVIVFDVGSLDNNDYFKDIKKISDFLNKEITRDKSFEIEYVRKEFITANHFIFENLAKYLNILFGSNYKLSGGLQFDSSLIFGEPIKKYQGKYVRVGISNQIYDRVVAIMPKLDVMLSRLEKGDKGLSKYILVYEQLNSSFKFREEKRFGQFAREWYRNINHNSYVWVCNNLVIEMRGLKIQAPKADFEFFNYEKFTNEASRKNTLGEEIYLLEMSEGHNKLLVNEQSELIDFSDKLNCLQVLDMSCKYENEDLELQLIEGIKTFDLENQNEQQFDLTMESLNFKPLCSFKVRKESIENATELYNDELLNKNSFTSNTIILHQKQPFIYPVAQIDKCDYIDYRHKPSVLKYLSEFDFGPYTNLIISIANTENFHFGSTEAVLNDNYEHCKLELSSYHKRILADLKELHKKNGSAKFPSLKDLTNSEEHRIKLRELNKRLHDAARSCGIENKNLGVMTLSKGKNSHNNANFKKEMEHFKSKINKSNYKGVGMNHNYVFISELFENLKTAFFSPASGICPDLIYDEFVSKDSRLLQRSKSNIISNNHGYYTYLRSTNLYNSCAFISRLCHTLMFHSQSSLNSSKVVVDNLGYDKVLLIIKGGKKIFSTKKSKLFRLIFPIYNACKYLYNCETMTSNFKTFQIEDRTFVCTPWQNMHETVIADGITFLHRTMGFAILNKIEDLNFKDNLNRVYFNVLLAIHNRRQTETMLHNLRYIFMNCMSEVSAIEEILPEMADFNYDFFQYWIRASLSQNFVSFALKLNDLHNKSKDSKLIGLEKSGLLHIFNHHKISDVNTLALSIYSSYLMSKAPTTQSLEQVKNMKSIMKIHDEFLREVKKVENCFIIYDKKKNFTDYAESLQQNDFNLDPSYCFLLGKFMGDYISNLEGKNRLIQKWDQILEEPWDEMANTKGLRGDNSDFFGNKGYYIVYKDVLTQGNFNSILDTLKSDLDPHLKEKKIKELNETFKSRIAKTKLSQVVFHVVDKVQRGGSREIYVMDKETKVHQQVIEEYTKYICKLIPNEMISIPSNKRLQHIHARVFETTREHNEKYYWVLDCRKWAPKSVIEKFMIFLMGAKDSLPTTFVIHALNFFHLMTQKRVYTRPNVVEILTKSDTNQQFKQYFKLDEDKKAYYFDMPYSWVMGIFNYFSSLMHVAVQLHSSHIIRLTTHLSFNEDNILHMVAHSDDSAGKIMVNNKHQMLRASFIYETLMHASNHLLSKKKCNQGKVYYEFISILYIGGTLLSLLSKFTGMFNYHPTDKGYCSDITDAYSKCTELLLNGATIEQCYLALKIQSYLIYRFYFGKDLPSKYYDMPPSLFGLPDAHPLMVLICGSDSDLFRIFKTTDDLQRKIILFLNENLLPFSSDRQGLIKAFKCSPRVLINNRLKDLQELIQIPEDLSNSWTLSNVKFKNTQINAIQFVQKLKDKSFLAALQDESLTRRLSRSYYFRSHLTVDTSFGDMHPREIRELIFLTGRAMKGDYEGIKDNIVKVLQEVHNEEAIQNYDTGLIDNLFDFIYCELTRLHDYLDKISYKDEDIVTNFKTCKPVYISMQKTIEECPVSYNPQALASWIKEPEFRHLLPDTRGFHTAELFVSRLLNNFELTFDKIDIQLLFPILQKVKQRSKSEYFCYSNLPSELREVSTYQDVLNFLSHNTFQNKMINGLAVQFGKTITMPMEHLNKNLSGVDMQFSLSFIILAISIMNSNDFKEEMLELEFLTPPFLKNVDEGSIKLKQLVLKICDYWAKLPNHYMYIKPLLAVCSCLLNNQKSFDADIIADSFYHSFVKRQLLIDNVWLGVGKMFLSLGKIKILFIISNIRVNKVLVQVLDYNFDSDQISYINICLQEAQLSRLQESMQNTTVEDWGDLGLCYNSNGEYYIGDVKDSLRFLPAQVDATLTTPLSNISKGRIRSFKGSKLIWDSYVDEEKTYYQISTLPIELQNSVSLLRGSLVDNLNNKNLLNADTDCKQMLIEVCAKELNLERTINVDNMLKNYHMTDLFKVIKKCQSLSLCTVINPEIKDSNIPAGDGGLLNALINYSKITPDFDFKWNRTISAEYMKLKAAQPEAFMTELTDQIKSRFDSLYTDVDKESIFKMLTALSNNLLEDDDTALLNLLCTWGYAGVAGALNELGGEEIQANFEKFRLYDRNSSYISLFKDLLFIVISFFFKSYKLGLGLNEFTPIEEIGGQMKINVKNLNYVMMSLFHSIILETYKTKKHNNWSFSLDYYHLNLMIACVLSNKNTADDFKKSIRSVLMFKNLPTNNESAKSWQILVNTLILLYVESNVKNYDLDFTMRRDLRPDILNPYVSTRDELAKIGIKIESKRLFHYGGISNYLYDNLMISFTEAYKDVNIHFNMIKLTYEELLNSPAVPFNSKYYPHKRFLVDFLETDEFDEIKTELQSSEIDIDYVESIIADYIDDGNEVWDTHKKKKIKAVVNGKLMDIVKYDLSLLILIGGNNSLEALDHLRMVAENIIILTDKLPMQLYNCEHFLTFRSKDAAWHGHSIKNPENLFYIVNFRDITDSQFWCRVLNAEVMNLNLMSQIRSSEYFSYRNRNGVLQNFDRIYSNDNLWDLIDQNINARIADEQERACLDAKLDSTSIGIDEHVQKIGDSLKDEGLDDTQVDKYLNTIKKGINEGEKSMLTLLNMFDKNVHDVENISSNIGLKLKVEELIKKPKSAKQHEMIMQVPKVFGGEKSHRINTKLHANIFREKKIIAEMEAMCPGVLWKLISGNLYISKSTKTLFENQLTMYQVMAKGARSHKKGKQFLINLFKLILNDTVTANEEDEEPEIWKELISSSLKLMLLDEDKSIEDDWEFIDEDSEMGDLRYGISSEREFSIV